MKSMLKSLKAFAVMIKYLNEKWCKEIKGIMNMHIYFRAAIHSLINTSNKKFNESNYDFIEIKV